MLIKIGTESIKRKPYYVDPTRHLNLIGGSGAGKSSLSETIFTGFVRQGYGALFLDAHGDVADRLPLLIPKNRTRDLVWLDPDAPAVPGFNPLYFSRPEELELAKETCLSILKALAGSDSAWGNETPYLVRNALDAVCESVPAPTLVHVFKFLLDAGDRRQLLNVSKNPFVKLFQKFFSAFDETQQSGKLSAGTNKVAKLMRPNVLPVIANAKSLDPLQLMNSRKIVVCRLSKGALGDETAQILYSFILSMFSIAALRREKQKVRTPFLIVADEAQNGIYGGRFSTLLQEARKYSLSLCCAFQAAHQAPFMPDVLTNAATQIVFNSSGADAKLLSENWHDPYVSPQHITELPRYEFYCRTFHDNLPVVSKVLAPPPLKPRAKEAQAIIKESLMRYATDKATVQKQVEETLKN